MIQSLLMFLSMFACLPAIAGPGGSGGNPLMITSLARNYSFSAPAPTAQQFSAQRDAFSFGLAGFRVEIVQSPYDAQSCRATNAVRTVCRRPDGSAVVVFGHSKAFTLRFYDTGIGAANLPQAAAEVVASFSPVLNPNQMHLRTTQTQPRNP